MDTEKKLVKNDDYVFGTRAVQEAVYAGKPIDKILFRKGINNELFHDLYNLIKQEEIPFQFVPVEKLNRITRKNHQGIIAFISPVEFQKIENILPLVYEQGNTPLILLLDEVTDVRNFGAILRSAECARVHAVIIPQRGTARIGGDAVKTSAGAIYHIPVCRTANLLSTIDFLKASGLNVIAASEKSDQNYTAADMTAPLAIVMGSEEKGISQSILEVCDQEVKIPVLGKIESLNVSVACSLMIYEAIRQRGINDSRG